MISFKSFLTEDYDPNQTIRNVETLPFHFGHDGVHMAADMLGDLHRTLLGKKATLKTDVQHQGLPIEFGIHPKTKQFVVGVGGKLSASPEEIEYNHKGNKPVIRQLKTALQRLPKIMMPGKSGLYAGKIVDMHNILNEAAEKHFGITIDSTFDGKPLTQLQRTKQFMPHPDVYIVNPSMRADPQHYDVGSQTAYNFFRKGAQDAYSKMSPDAFDIVQGHEGEMQSYLNKTKEEPDVKGYAQHIMDKYTKKLAAKGVDRAKVARKYDKLMQNFAGNEKHFDSVIKLMHNLRGAKNIVSDIAKANGNHADIMLDHGGNKALLKH